MTKRSVIPLAFVFLLAACSSQQGPGSSSTAPPESTSTSSPASPAPDGRIAFIEARQDNKGPLYTMAPDGSDVRQLTDFDIEGPAWSPDGTKIAFDSDKAGGIHIFTVNADGTGLKQITNGEGEGWPSWSPDGTHMAIDGPSGINIVDVSTGEMKPITVNPYGNQGYDSLPQYSPDGTLIAFHRAHNASSTVFIMNVDGSGLRRLTGRVTPPGMTSGDPNWSPDGSRLVLNIVTSKGRRSIYVINSDGTGLRRLTRAKNSDDFHASWSPDGRTIIFTRYTFAPRSEMFAFYSMRPDGTDTKLLYRTPVTDVNEADWGPPS